MTMVSKSLAGSLPHATMSGQHISQELRRGKQLSHAIRQINALLADPEHRQVAMGALRRMGLWHDDLGDHADSRRG